MSFVAAVQPPTAMSPRALWFVSRGSELWMLDSAAGSSLPGRVDVLSLGLDPAEAHYLGRLDGEDCFAIDAGPGQPVRPWVARNLRGLYGELDEQTFTVAVRAVQAVAFGSTHRFCGRCGQRTSRHATERKVQCPSCGLDAYPRIAPAIIVLVRRGDEALLAHAARFPSKLYSTLAGFVEAGESLEQTLQREVREEVGIEVADLRYFGSQPWPFPHSLMVGFTARYAAGEVVPDGVEIIDARWFRADALPAIPPRPSIARRLIDAWVAEVASGQRG